MIMMWKVLEMSIKSQDFGFIYIYIYIYILSEFSSIFGEKFKDIFGLLGQKLNRPLPYSNL